MNQIILDTNAFSLYVKKNKTIFKEVEQSDVTCLSVVSVGELIYGFSKGSKTEHNKLILNSFLDNPLVKLVNINKNIAVIYGELYYILQKSGTPIPVNDIWIAACAIETDSMLITYDKHFLSIPKLKLWDKINE